MLDHNERAAVDAGAISTGVVNNERFETLSSDIHGFGQRHSCKDPGCARCNTSTDREPYDEPIRAGEDPQNADQGGPLLGARDTSRNNGKIAAGNVDEIMEGLDEERHASCSDPACSRCNNVNDRMLQREVKVSVGGGGSAGRRRSGKAGTKVCRNEGCGLTLCEHVRTTDDKKMGAPTKPNARTSTVAFKVAKEAKAVAQRREMAKLVNRMARMVLAGHTYDDLSTLLKAECRVCASLPPNIICATCTRPKRRAKKKAA